MRKSWEDDKVEMKKTILACVIICQSFFLFACAKENGKADDMKTMIEHAEFINNQSNMELSFLELIENDPKGEIGGDRILIITSKDGIVEGEAYHYPEESTEVRVVKISLEQESEHDILGIRVGDTYTKAKELAEKAGFVYEKNVPDNKEEGVTYYSYQWGNIFLTLKVNEDAQIVRILLAAK